MPTAVAITGEDITTDAGELPLVGFFGRLPRQRLEEPPQETGDEEGDEER
jgi:hypothetical protein